MMRKSLGFFLLIIGVLFCITLGSGLWLINHHQLAKTATSPEQFVINPQTICSTPTYVSPYRGGVAIGSLTGTSSDGKQTTSYLEAIRRLGIPAFYNYSYTAVSEINNQERLNLIAKHVYIPVDPSSLKLLSSGTLANPDFAGIPGQVPTSWVFWASGGPSNGTASVDMDVKSPNNDKNADLTLSTVRITHINGANGTQISQKLNRNILSNHYVIFGTWVKAAHKDDYAVFLQNSNEPYQSLSTINFNNSNYDAGNQINNPQATGDWQFIMGYGQIPEGVTEIQLVLRALRPNTSVWFDGATAVAVDAEDNAKLTEVISKQCGSVWFIDNEPGYECNAYTPALDPKLYALIYHSFYSRIKAYDPHATVLPAGLAGSPLPYDSPVPPQSICASQSFPYSPKSFTDNWRNAYQQFFGSPPPIDAFNIHYYEVNNPGDNDGHNCFADSYCFDKYMRRVRSHLDSIPDWAGKPIWISEIGVIDSPDNTSHGVDYARAITNYLKTNSQGIQRWFWFSTCWTPDLISLYTNYNPVNQNSQICAYPYSLTPAGKVFADLNSGMDITQDGTVNSSDYQFFISTYRQHSNSLDINHDSVSNVLDINRLRYYLQSH